MCGCGVLLSLNVSMFRSVYSLSVMAEPVLPRMAPSIATPELAVVAGTREVQKLFREFV